MSDDHFVRHECRSVVLVRQRMESLIGTATE
jgi:hypothetical protein